MIDYDRKNKQERGEDVEPFSLPTTEPRFVDVPTPNRYKFVAGTRKFHKGG